MAVYILSKLKLALVFRVHTSHSYVYADLFKDFRTHVSIIVNGQIGLISAIMVVSNLRIEKR